MADIGVLQTKIDDVLSGRGKGSNNWEKDFDSTTVELSGGETVTTTDELTTEMRRRSIDLVDSHGSPTGETWATRSTVLSPRAFRRPSRPTTTWPGGPSRSAAEACEASGPQ
jgi:hypothetical protein